MYPGSIPQNIEQSSPVPRHRGLWWRVLLTAFAFYLIGIALLFFTRNPNLFPTVVMLGNFMIPASYVAFFYERRHLSQLTLPTTTSSFVYGGLLGIFAASLLEPIFIRSLDVFTVFTIGLIEEFVKILGVLVIAVLRNGLNVIGVGAMWQPALIGLVIIAAIVFDVVLKQRGVIR